MEHNTTQLFANRRFTTGDIDPRLFGSFVEHMGRTVYTGIYEPGHPRADGDGLREDVLALVREMGVTTVRYPGGNYVSCYHWEDSVGPVEQRPRRLELAWQQVESNAFGLAEFMRWAEKAGVEPILAVNLGTRGIEEAAAFVEYCNHPGGSHYSELRRTHGNDAPFAVKTWCLGNEMDGDWQIGHKTAAEYGRLAEEAAKAMRRVDPGLELVSCGSSKSDMASHPAWDLETLEHTYNQADVIAVHQYYGGQEMGTPGFLAQSLDFERYLATIRAVCDVVKAKKRSDKTLMISVDEWGVWNNADADLGDIEPFWREKPAFSEQIYTMEDTLLFASMLMAMVRNADRVKIACQSLLTNISACIMTKPGGEAWVQPIYYPFAHMANHARGTVLSARQQGPAYACAEFASVPYLDTLLVHNHAQNEVVLFAVNRSETEALPLQVALEGFETEGIAEQLSMTAPDKHSTNKQDHSCIQPKPAAGATLDAGILIASLPAFSWNMVRVRCKSQDGKE